MNFSRWPGPARACPGAAGRCLAGLLLLCAALLPACGGGGGGGGGGAPSAPAAAGHATVALEVPHTMAVAPLDRSRLLEVPPGMGVRVLARVPAARFMQVTPNGDVLVSQPAAGRILLVRPQGNGEAAVSTFADGLTNPHGMALADLGGRWWLYVAESDRVSRAPYSPGDARVGALQTLMGGLPDASTPELNGTYAHALKSIVLRPAGVLYRSIASSCNACDEDARAEPLRGAIYRYDADGGNGRLLARGIRNAEGLALLPGTEQLWAVVNGRDDIAWPLHSSASGGNGDDFGRVLPDYVQLNPPEQFIQVRDGAHHGWPYCNAVPNAAMTDLASAPDAQLNPDQSRLDCGTVARSDFGLPAHSAPLGMAFLQGTPLPSSLTGGAAVALHGCWDCTAPVGYKVALVNFDGNGRPVAMQDLVTGFVGTALGSAWGRPVDVVVHPQRASLLVSDDLAGAIYELYAR